MALATEVHNALPRQQIKYSCKASASMVNGRFHIARCMISSPFTAPPPARKGDIFGTDGNAGFGVLKASEVSRVVRALPFVLDGIPGCTATLFVNSLLRCELEPC